MLEKLLEKLDKQFNLSEKMELVEHIESIMYDEDSLTIYETYDSAEKIKNIEETVDKYLSRFSSEEELEDFEEQHFLDCIRGLVCTYESNDDEISQIKLFMKLFNYFNS